MRKKTRLDETGDDLSGEGLGFPPGSATLDAIVPVRLTRAQKETLAEIARELGLSLSGYLRKIVLGQPLPPRRPIRPIPELNQQTYVELGRIGANLNQLTQRVHAGEVKGGRELLAILELLAGALGKLRGQVIGVEDPSSSGEAEA